MTLTQGDINRLFNYWNTWGRHRMTSCGELQRPVEHMAALLGFKIIEEA